MTANAHIWLFRCVVGTIAALIPLRSHSSTAEVDVAIVFAVDASSSIDADTANLQRNGHAEALTSPEVLKAITGNYLGCISVTYFEWSSPGRSRVVLPWTKICGLEDAEVAASTIRAKGYDGFGRRGRAGTSISSAIDIAGLLLDRLPHQPITKVIDISANGENNDGLPVGPSRLNAIAKGYTINAIAIPVTGDNSDIQLASYFSQNIVGGPAAFVVESKGADDYASALRRKLVTEISLNVACRVCRQQDG